MSFKEEKTKHQGVYQKKLASGDISFYIRYRISGIKNPKKEKVGNKSEGMTADKAFKILLDKKEDVKLGKTNKNNIVSNSNNFTFEKLYIEYIRIIEDKAREDEGKAETEKVHKTLSNIKREKSIYKSFWGGWILRKMPLKKITHEHIKIYLKDIKKSKDYSDKSIYNGVAFAKTIIKHTKHIYKGFNPFEDFVVTRPKNTNRQEILSEDDCKLLLKTLKDRTDSIQPYAMTLCALATGTRPNSIFNLKIKDVDFSTNTIKFCDFKRQRMSYYVNLTKELAKVLKQIIGSRHINDYLFYSSYSEGKKPLSGFPNILEHTLDDLFNKNEYGEFIRSGRDKIVPYTLRHTFASLLAKREVPIFTIQKLLNHKSVQTTIDNYAKFFPDFASKHVQSFEDVILE